MDIADAPDGGGNCMGPSPVGEVVRICSDEASGSWDLGAEGERDGLRVARRAASSRSTRVRSALRSRSRTEMACC